jgi:YHS domain-containing protein
MRRNFLLGLIGCVDFMRKDAWAADKVGAVNADRESVALQGYDTVAYFTWQRPAKGSAEFAYRWMGANWLFVSAENRDKFAAAPEQYAPQFGGYCAWAVSNNYTAPIDPAAWKIVDGKLYLNYNKSVQKKWQTDLHERIAAGEKNWPSLHR